MAADRPSTPTALWAQAYRTWTDAWLATAGRAVPAAGPTTDPNDLWKRFFNQWLDGWNVLLEQTLTSPETVALGGKMLDASLNIEKPVRERTAAFMEYWLDFYNLPSRTDLVNLARQVNEANARLDQLQVEVENLSDQVTALTPATVRGNRPAVAVTGGDA